MLMNLQDVQSIQGKILTIIDSLGLATKQEDAVKSLVRQAIWDEVHQPYRVWVSHVMVDEASKEWRQYKGHGFNFQGARPLQDELPKTFEEAK